MVRTDSKSLSSNDVSILTFKKKTYLVLTYLVLVVLVALTIVTMLLVSDQADPMILWFLYVEFPIFLFILVNVQLKYRRVKVDLSNNQKELLEAVLKEKYQRRGRYYFVLDRISYLLTSTDIFDSYETGHPVKIWIAPKSKLLLTPFEPSL